MLLIRYNKYPLLLAAEILGAQLIAAKEQKASLEKEIARLEKLARAEKQPKKKFELVQQIQRLQRLEEK